MWAIFSSMMREIGKEPQKPSCNYEERSLGEKSQHVEDGRALGGRRQGGVFSGIADLLSQDQLWKHILLSIGGAVCLYCLNHS